MTTDVMRTLRENLPAADDVLHAVGLQVERSASVSALTTVAAFAIGALVGAALTALYAPKPGRETRHDLNERVREIGERMGWSGRRADDDEAAAH